MNRPRRPPPLNPSQNTNPIPQPPHTAGTPLQGLRTKLDPVQIPSTAHQITEDEDRWTKESYLTVGEQPVPLSASQYHAIDQGNSTPRFLRPTIYAVPASADLQGLTHVPFGIHITPLAQQAPEEAPIPVVDFGEAGPPRCEALECRAYINPWCTWEGGGLRWICNLCGKVNDAPPEYLSAPSTTPRAELQKGTVDFLVPAVYWAPVPPKRLIHAFVPVTVSNSDTQSRKSMENKLLPIGNPETATRNPTPMNYVFALDVSLEAVQSGFLESACKILLEVLYGNSNGETENPEATSRSWWNPESKLAIVTFDRELCFYDFDPDSPQAKMLIVSDIEEVFAPMPSTSTLFVDPQESRTLLEPLLSNLSNTYSQTVCAQAALGSSIAAALSLLSQSGGQVVVFGTCLPKIGLGMLTDRDNERTMYNTENEPILFKPREAIWKEMAEECVDCGVGVSLVMAPSRWADLGTLGVVPKLTGGDMYFHPKFDPERDQEILASQIRRLVNRETGYQATLRLRCTTGMHVKAHYGNAWERSATDVNFGTVDADKSVYASLDYTSALDNFSSLTLDTISSLINQKGTSTQHHQKQSIDTAKQAYFQSALLYTTAAGERRVRVCNLSLPVVALAGNVYRYGDYEGVVAALAKIAMAQMSLKPLRDIRDSLTAQCAELLLHYRRYCAAASAASQLILPEGFTLLPVYINCLLKSRPLKGKFMQRFSSPFFFRSLGTFFFWVFGTFLALPFCSSFLADFFGFFFLGFFHFLAAMELLGPSVGFPVGLGMRATDDGEVMFMWLGGDVEESNWRDLFGVSNAHELKPVPKRLPELSNSFSTRVRAIVANLEYQTGITRRFIIVRQNLDALEIDFANMLMEDTNNDGMSYLDYLCYVHRLISHSLDNGYSAITVGKSTSKKIPW
ncbi:hypothetical protein M408DRAFT_332978 [Serendipita vermifera MAFF 305830]|uniref:Sec23/Sec24 trunk domain-containing protein n=1 Tax=Serendipita vermifera MAFF 305830 TaxID=933852 RepID=A0A0C2W755_SERVB|nr:hypothetical protein M408DRAFT_332978 [Serendipita vermifera MAFF 305830]